MLLLLFFFRYDTSMIEIAVVVADIYFLKNIKFVLYFWIVFLGMESHIFPAPPKPDPITFHANHPFIYYIADKKRVVLFGGKQIQI